MLSKNLKFIRTRLFLTQEAFGNYFNLTRHQINSYEISRANVPPALVSQVCKIFEIEISIFETRELLSLESDWKNITIEKLESALDAPKSNQVNEWKEKYYTVLEKYNEALEELRKYKKLSE